MELFEGRVNVIIIDTEEGLDCILYLRQSLKWYDLF